jgi:hypothetical protein
MSHHIRSTVRPTVADTLARYGLKKAMRVIGQEGTFRLATQIVDNRVSIQIPLQQGCQSVCELQCEIKIPLHLSSIRILAPQSGRLLTGSLILG